MLTVILTGGGSRRMGRDKAMLSVGNSGLGMRDELIRRYSQLGKVAASVDKTGRYTGGDAVELPDAFPGMGPLNGIYSAFRLTNVERVFLTATDIINGDVDLALYLLSELKEHDACVIRRRLGYVEPLFAVYARSCATRAEECLREGRYSMLELINHVDTHYIDEKQLSDRWNLDRILLNINTPEDYEKFRAN